MRNGGDTHTDYEELALFWRLNKLICTGGNPGKPAVGFSPSLKGLRTKIADGAHFSSGAGEGGYAWFGARQAESQEEILCLLPFCSAGWSPLTEDIYLTVFTGSDSNLIRRQPHRYTQKWQHTGSSFL